MVVFSIFMFMHAYTQDNVAIKIPGKHDLIYNGLTLQLYAPNLSVGKEAGLNIGTAIGNTIFGQEAAKKLSLGDNNTIIGYQAGGNNEGSGNIFIGYQAGIQQSAVSDKLYISNSSTNSPLIYGDFSTRRVTINDNMTVAGNILAWNNITLGNDLNVENNLSVNNDLVVDKEVTLNNYASNSTDLLAVQSNGKLITIAAQKTRFNKYSFIENPDVSSSFSRDHLGVYLPDGTTINGLEAILLDNNNSPSVSSSTAVFTYFKRRSKFSSTAPENIIYRIISYNTSANTFAAMQSTVLVSGCSNCNVIDNDNYIYYFDIVYCNDCDYRELTILE